VLADSPADREAWFALHAERTRAAAREWLDDHGVEMEDAPARGRPSDDRREN